MGCPVYSAQHSSWWATALCHSHFAAQELFVWEYPTLHTIPCLTRYTQASPSCLRCFLFLFYSPPFCLCDVLIGSEEVTPGSGIPRAASLFRVKASESKTQCRWSLVIVFSCVEMVDNSRTQLCQSVSTLTHTPYPPIICSFGVKPPSPRRSVHWYG